MHKSFFAALSAAALLLSSAPLTALAEEMVETGPAGTVSGVDSNKIALDSTNFPDQNFLTSLKNNNPNAQTAADVTTIVVPSSALNVDGIQYLDKATSFEMKNNNNVSTLDLSNCTSLEDGAMTAAGYPAPGITITNNDALISVTLPDAEDLTSITITGNHALDSLDLSACGSLQTANIADNSIDELDLSQNKDLTVINALDNDLYTLDATPCRNLQTLNVSRNKLYELKVPSKALTQLIASGNKLNSFDASGLSKLSNLTLNNNMLQSVELSTDAEYGTLNLANNHLASLDLSNISFTAPRTVTISPQSLYVDDETKAIKITDYDPNFNYKNAYFSNGKRFDKDAIFTIPAEPGEQAKIEINNLNTQVVTDGTDYFVYVNGTLIGTATAVTVDGGNTVKTASFTIAKNSNGSFTVTGNGNYIGTATVSTTPLLTAADGALTATLSQTSYDFTGGRITPTVTSVTFTPKDNKGNLLSDQAVQLDQAEYTVGQSADETLGPQTVTIEGLGKYAGLSTNVQITIVASPLNKAKSINVNLGTTAANGDTTSLDIPLTNIVITPPAPGATSITLTVATDQIQFGPTATFTTGTGTEIAATVTNTSSTSSIITIPNGVNGSNAVAGTLTGTLVIPNDATTNYKGSVPFSVEIKDEAIASAVQTPSVTLLQSALVEEMSEAAPALTNRYSFYTYDTEYPGAAGVMEVRAIREALMNRLYNPNSGEHFYTKSIHEKDVLVELGWQYEGYGWVAPTAAQSTIPVYRLYNPNAGDHHYTKDPNEKDTLVRVGWDYEGVGWYSANPSTVNNDNPNADDAVTSIEVFREYNPNAKAAGAHNYTINEIENSVLVSIGWIDEGIAWWALK